MSSTIEEIEETIREAITTGFRGRLLERGLARSMIWVDGELPDGAPRFDEKLSYDLLSYGYSLLSLTIRLNELGGDANLCQAAFEKSAIAITDVIHKGKPEDPERGFHKVLAASAYHLGRFSAKAYSLLQRNVEVENLSPIEKLLSLLMLRQFTELDAMVMAWKASGVGSDEFLASKLELEINQLNQVKKTEEEPEEYGIASVEIPIVNQAITDNYFSAIFEFLFALETGSPNLLQGAINRVETSLTVCGELNLLPQWWVLRVTKHLLKDLWESSFHRIIPVLPHEEHNEDWCRLRWLFIASLFKRNTAEIELWPSQLEGAKRAVNDIDDLVVSLPTSAGKTRIAELCILRCLAIGKRVLFITPLRALSAQTEYSLRKTFLPLGKSVSSLYGSIGTSDFEQDVLKTRDIVVGTPEKLDFALRNDPSLIDDVGLIVLDEGHMIGINEREINYEIQIQRLLKRFDADQRRIVCLSAILPSGEQFEDFVAWLRRDKEGDAIQSNWRPTDLRFGEIVWQGHSGKIDFTIGEELAFIPGYIRSFVPPTGRRKAPFPRNAQELTLAAAWRLTQDNHTVLIYCPQRKSVNAFAKAIVDLHMRGALESVLTVPEKQLELARILGTEWLGDKHPIIQCLNIGVAVHHGALPTPFRKEMEKLLRLGVLKITVSSPTLAQGLNLSATVVIVHSLYRSGNLIEPSEFKNVVGRAGRAFVDTHGLVLHPVYDSHDWRKKEWQGLANNENARNLESGLVRLVLSLLLRIAEKLGTRNTQPIQEYILNSADAWNFPVVAGETAIKSEENNKAWKQHLVSLDTALLSLIGGNEIPDTEIENALDVILQSSLWQRRLNHHDDNSKELFNSLLTQRGKYIWSASTVPQRKGYFLAGVGLETGLMLDSIALQANTLLINANAYILNQEPLQATNCIIDLADLLFDIPPFKPSVKPENWKIILKVWLSGEALREQSFIDIDQTLRFVEDALIYRLPWGMEAVRVRALANDDEISEENQIKDYMIVKGGIIDEHYELGLVVPAVENGTLNRSAAMLMQSGFNSRLAAIIAINSTGANFTNSGEFNSWLQSESVKQFSNTMTWPTPETAPLWQAFRKEYQPRPEATWKGIRYQLPVNWDLGAEVKIGQLVKLNNAETGMTQVLGVSGDEIGRLKDRYNLLENGVYYSEVDENRNLLATFWGASDTPFSPF
jgi:hypothetical protein